MRKIISIQHVEFFIGKDKKKHSRTYAILDDGSEAVGYGKNFKINDSVEYFFHKEVAKMRLKA